MKVPPLPRPHETLLSAYAQGLSSTEIERLFTRDTAEAYRFFSRHIDVDALAKLPWCRRWFTRGRMVFLAFTMRLSPGRRALYGASLVVTTIGLIELFQGLHLFLIPHPVFAPGTLWLLTGFLLLNLLMLIEVADPGQNPPCVRRTDGRYDSLREGGVAVGMFEQASYDAGTTRLEVGDVLVMFSDGVVEAENARVG